MKLILLFACFLLAACDQLAELDGSKAAEADGKAVGGACRHAGRALEDCYALNERAPKAAVFAGWREMNDYMTQNKIETVPPEIVKKPAAKADDGHGKAPAPKEAAAPKEDHAPKGDGILAAAGKDGAAAKAGAIELPPGLITAPPASAPAAPAAVAAPATEKAGH